MDLRVAAYAVVERRGKILLTHWRRGHLHGWTLPGGGIDPGEDPRDAVVREVMEETGLEAKVGRLLGVDSRVLVREEVLEGTDPELHTIRIVYRASVLDGPLRNEVGGSSDEARWVSLKELKSLKTLSLVQTGLRMAGIARRGPTTQGKGQAAQGKNPQAQGKSGSGRSRQRSRSQQSKNQFGKVQTDKAPSDKAQPNKAQPIKTQPGNTQPDA